MPRNQQNKKIWELAISAKRERLTSSLNWFPLPAFIGIGLSLIFVGHVFFGLNPRLGNPAEVIYFDAEPLKDGGIWLSVSIQEEKLVVTTADRSVFKITLSGTDVDEISKLTDYLREQTKKLSINAGLSQKISTVQSTAVISADQKLKYGHVRPILVALARAGISNYGFETKMQLHDVKL